MVDVILTNILWVTHKYSKHLKEQLFNEYLLLLQYLDLISGVVGEEKPLYTQ